MHNPEKKRVRGRKPWRTYLLLSLAVLVALGLTWRFAFPEHFSSVFASGTKQDTHPGKVGVLISPVPISAFTAIDPATFLDPNTGDFRVAWISEKAAVDGGFIRDPAAIRGRVLKLDKGANLGFTEADFFPRGSRASLTSALEPGQRSVNLNASEIEGLRSLKRFDRFDLYAVKPKAAIGTTGYMNPEAAEAAETGREWATNRLVIAQGAKILVPVPEGKNAKNPDSVEVAMKIEEATALADAKAKGAKIMCLGSSGLPGGDQIVIEAPTEAPVVDTIKVMNGPESSTAYVKSTKPEADKPKSEEPPH
jgi:hypothetical protein